MAGTNLSANWMGPVVVNSTGGVNLGVTNDNRALLVAFDNDGFVSYNATPIDSSGFPAMRSAHFTIIPPATDWWLAPKRSPTTPGKSGFILLAPTTI